MMSAGRITPKIGEKDVARVERSHCTPYSMQLQTTPSHKETFLFIMKNKILPGKVNLAFKTGSYWPL